MPLASNDLSAVLVERMDCIARMSGSMRPMRHRIRPGRIDDVLDKARTAVACGDGTALEQALLSVELLSLELCEE